MKRRLFKFLLYRYQQEVVTEKERQLFDQWYDYLDKQPINVPDKLDMRQEDALKQLLLKISNQQSTKVKTLSAFKTWFAAASVLLAALLGGLYWYQQAHRVQEAVIVSVPAYRLFETKVGERKQISLPDGSSVTLNARSILRIDQDTYGKETRTVELLAGEAFFAVEKDSSRAFIVHTSALQTQVLGTSFNIQAYSEMPEQVISVYSGRVQVKRGEQSLGVLQPGEQIRFEKVSENSAIEKFAVEKNNGWVAGRSMLRQASFAELALAIRNNYGIILKASNSRVARQQYSLPIQEQVPLQDVLRAIRNIHNNKSRKEGDTVLIY